MINNIVLTGRIVADPALKTTPQGVSVCNFRLAVDRPFSTTDALTGKREKKTDFVTITTWRNNADFAAKYFIKGRMVGVEGQLRTQDYEKEGVKQHSFYIEADRLSFMDSKKNEECEEE